MLYSGSHVLGGTLELREPAAAVLAAWLAHQKFADEFDERDTRWWLDSIARPRGNCVAIWEDCRSSYGRVAARAQAIDDIAASARSGRMLLVHTENGYHTTEWTIADGIVTKQARSARVAPRQPTIAAADRRFLEMKTAEVAERYRTLGDADQFRELIANIPNRSCLVLQGGPPELRSQLFEYIAAQVGKPARFVADLIALSNEEQMELRDQLGRAGTVIVIGSDGDLADAEQQGRLRVDLYYRMSAGQRWTVKDSDAALIRR